MRQRPRAFLRHTLTVLATLSLLLCMLTCLLWWGSYRKVFSLWRYNVWPSAVAPALRDSTSTRIAVGWGRLTFDHDDSRAQPSHPWRDRSSGGWVPGISLIQPTWTRPTAGEGSTFVNRLGFGWTRRRFTPMAAAPAAMSGSTLQRSYAMPLWPVALAFAIAPTAVILSRLEQRRRRRHGCCEMCGYDLRAHTSGDRCPECGTPAVT